MNFQTASQLQYSYCELIRLEFNFILKHVCLIELSNRCEIIKTVIYQRPSFSEFENSRWNHIGLRDSVGCMVCDKYLISIDCLYSFIFRWINDRIDILYTFPKVHHWFRTKTSFVLHKHFVTSTYRLPFNNHSYRGDNEHLFYPSVYPMK